MPEEEEDPNLGRRRMLRHRFALNRMEALGDGHPALKAFHETVGIFGGAGNWSSSSSSMNSKTTVHAEYGGLTADFTFDPEARTFHLKLVEKQEPQRTLAVEEDGGSGLTLRYADPSRRTDLLFTQTPKGQIRGTVSFREEKAELAAESLEALLRADPWKAERFVFGILRELGIQTPLHELMPEVVAVATGWYSAPPAAAAKKAEALIAQLSADDHDVREQAHAELDRCYLQALWTIRQALANPKDEEAKVRLARITAAHPELERLRAFVEEKQLHVDQVYLHDLMKNAPAFKEAARARLAALLGKDHGDDPAAWPPPAPRPQLKPAAKPEPEVPETPRRPESPPKVIRL
jgi:hypothetical protein